MRAAVAQMKIIVKASAGATMVLIPGDSFVTVDTTAATARRKQSPAMFTCCARSAVNHLSFIVGSSSSQGWDFRVPVRDAAKARGEPTRERTRNRTLRLLERDKPPEGGERTIHLRLGWTLTPCCGFSTSRRENPRFLVDGSGARRLGVRR